MSRENHTIKTTIRSRWTLSQVEGSDTTLPIGGSTVWILPLFWSYFAPTQIPFCVCVLCVCHPPSLCLFLTHTPIYVSLIAFRHDGIRLSRFLRRVDVSCFARGCSLSFFFSLLSTFDDSISPVLFPRLLTFLLLPQCPFLLLLIMSISFIRPPPLFLRFSLSCSLLRLFRSRS